MVEPNVAELESLMAELLKEKSFNQVSFGNVAELLAGANDLTVESYLNQINKKFGIAKRALQSYIPKEEEEDSKGGGTPLITVVENFIKKHYEVRFNIVSNNFEYRQKWKNDNKFEQFNEANVWRDLAKNYINFDTGNIKNLIRSDFTPKYDPFLEYFKSLQYDGKTDYIQKLCKYIILDNESDRARFETQMRKNFIRNVACSLGRDFNKQILTLIGSKHNQGKSYFIRWLLPKALEGYLIENVDQQKDLLRSLTENFIFNIDDMGSMRKFDLNTMKTMVSKDVVKVRIQYDTKFSTMVRRANFYASANEEEFLTDVTGSVRYLIFKVDSFNYSYEQEISIDDVWAQAYYLYQSGEKYKFTKDEEDENNNLNRDYYVTNTETQLVNANLIPSEKGVAGSKFCTATEILNYLSGICDGSIKLNSIGIGKALRFLGFKQVPEYKLEFKYQEKGYWVIFRNELEPSKPVETQTNIQEFIGPDKTTAKPPF